LRSLTLGNTVKLTFASLFIPLVLTSCAGSPTPTTETAPQATATISLPVEVIGPDGYIERRSFQITDPNGIDTLYVRCHRCGWRDGSKNTTRGAKASVRLNTGPWVDVKDSSVTVQEPEKSYGGLSGGFFTTRFTIPIRGAVAGTNTLEFRFNGTDGITSGYRILNFNLRRGTQNVLANTVFNSENPGLWQPVLTSSSDLQQGKTLWESAPLKESPLSGARTLQASCSDCHAADGRDLKYFNYSNWSIEARSKFHGLNTRQAQQISSYIRSLDLHLSGTTRIVASARPWNPPYQPGVGLDAKPVEEWAAGAGLSAVLARDADMLPYLFPDGVGGSAIEGVIDSRKTLNVREMPVALQFPDWNAWLPEVHPKDIWANWAQETPAQEYHNARTALETTGVDVLISQNKLLSLLPKFNFAVRDFIAANATKYVNGTSAWRVLAGKNLPASLASAERELRKLSLAQWDAVKQWELVTGFNLEDKAPRVLPNGSELRAWPSSAQSVHPIAPHIVSDDINDFEWQSLVVGKYFSTVWYQLQMTINSGQRQAVNVEPQDWPYQFKHVRDLSQVSGVPQAARYVQSLIKAYQMRDNKAGPVENGWQLRITHPHWLYGETENGDTKIWDELEAAESGLRNRVVEALVRDSLRVVESFAMSSWRRCGGAENTVANWYCVQDASYIPKLPATRQFFAYPQNIHADNFYKVLPLLRQQGVNLALLKELATWCGTIWPKGDWQAQLLRTVTP
jgi:hypothetical protein